MWKFVVYYPYERGIMETKTVHLYEKTINERIM